MVLVHLFAKFRAIFAGLLLLCAAGLSPAAQAWEVCNETSYLLRYATAVTFAGDTTAKGWTRLNPGQCDSLDVPKGDPRFIFAESLRAHQGGIREWRGQIAQCAIDDDFQSDPKVPCDLQNLGTRNFLAVDPAEERTAFVEPSEYGQLAQAAGIQRLLGDAGYDIASIDGKDGRQTTRALEKFLKDNTLAKDITKPALFSALEAAAIARQNDVGVIVCNRAPSRIWTAIAFREDAGWESRGWWAVDPESCLRPFTSSIKNKDAHIFALMEQGEEDDLELKSGTAVPAQFCVAQSRFSTLAREDCADRGYRAASFRPLANDKDGVQVNLSVADFIKPNRGGLRR